MAIRGMLSLLQGLGNGYNRQTQQEFDNTRKTKLDQIALDRAARDSTEFAQAQDDRTELRNAAQPVVAQPDMVQGTDGPVQASNPDPSTDSIDVGQPGTAPAIPAYRVGMQTALSPAQSATATAEANTPEAIRARQLAVLQRQSPEKAAILQAHDLSIKNTQMDLANKEFDSAASAAASKGWDAFGAFMNDSNASDAKGKWVPSSDGKTMQAYKQGPDGSLAPSGLIFENSPKGLAEAATFVSKQVPITAKLKHFMDEKEAARREGHDLATEKYQTGMLDVAKQNADTNSAYKDQAGAALTARTTGGGGKADHYEAKEWYDAQKPDKGWFTSTDEVTGKELLVPSLQDAYLRRFSELRTRGDLNPIEARAQAYSYSVGIQDRADVLMKEAQSQKQPMDMKQAVAIVRKRMAEVGAPPAAPPSPPAPPGTTMQGAAGKKSPPPAPPAGPSVQDQISAAQAPVASDFQSRLQAQSSAASKAAADPDLMKLEQLRVEAIRANKPMVANNVIAQIVKLRQERYGLN